MDPALRARLGGRITQLREARGFSLSALAERANMAKSNLSNLEQGLGNPTVDTLWRLAGTLGVTFGELVDTLEAPLSFEESPPNGIVTTLLCRQGEGARIDVYLMRFERGAQRIAAAHPAGVIEHALVLAGELELGANDSPERLVRGQTSRFAADIPHCYRNLGDTATILLTIFYR
ncbi:helix-turn-helix domain-containing protein [Halotalea alkalilenta]|uniref:helix-turn-helix domain-containing protein n=1 Tax=Halotalea alkalilenta TaxID=376489 RepID=UPI0004886F96|nr:XRE family transcriptional regulator [Halotalea alkalilenta]